MKKLLWTVILLVGCNLIYFGLDYFNIPTLLGINITNINLELAALIVGNTVVIGLFLITYLLIDKQQLKKEKNQKKSAYLMLKDTYSQFQVTVEIFCGSEFRNNFCSFENTKELFEDVEKVQVLKYVFENEEILIDFIKTGILHPDFYETYIDIKLGLSAFLSAAIWAKSEDEAIEGLGKILLEKIAEEEERIEELIKQEEDYKKLQTKKRENFGKR